jgi:DNA repair photolyase
MRTIYQPTGRALEYSPLALNLYQGCASGCKYCYAPAVMRATPAEFHNPTHCVPRPGIIEALEKKAPRYAGTKLRCLLCFMCDPYQKAEEVYRVTHNALIVLGANRIPATVLTKNPGRAIYLDGNLLRETGTWLGTTMVFNEEKDRQHWEPYAQDVDGRCMAIHRAHEAGIRTWVSLEPVIDPAQTLAIMRRMAGDVDEFKVGKLNHDAERSAKIDWRAFALTALLVAEELKVNLTLKNDLVAVLPEGNRAEYLAKKEATDVR